MREREGGEAVASDQPAEQTDGLLNEKPPSPQLGARPRETSSKREEPQVQLVAHYVTSFVSRSRSERGQDLLEYAMLGGLIAGAIMVVFGLAIFEGAFTDLANGIGRCIDFDSSTTCDAAF
jgi:hypothetical protein